MKNLKSTWKYGLVLPVIVAMSACATPVDSRPPVHKAHPIQIAESVERLELYSRPDGMSLSARDSDAVAQFLDGYMRFGDGPLYMNSPAHSTPGTHQTKNMVQTMVAQLGGMGAPIQEGQYMAPPNSPVIVSYRRLKTLPRNCSLNSDLSSTYTNQPWSEFGCAQNANLGVMVSPDQLLAPNPFSAPDMRRRMTVYDKYIKGESPASQLPPNQSISSTEGN